MQALRVFTDTLAKQKFVIEYDGLPGFDFLKLPRSTQVPVEVLVAADQLDQFKSSLSDNHVKYEVFAEDVSKVIEEELAQQSFARMVHPRSPGSMSFKTFPRYTEVSDFIVVK